MTQGTRTGILEATERLVQQHGLHGTTLSRILEESAAPRGSVYFHFPGGKDQIVLEAMLAGVGRVDRQLEALLVQAAGPAEAVRAYVDAAAAELRATEFVFGCPVAPVVLDSPGYGSQLAAACRETMEKWQRVLADHFERAGAERQRAEQLATFVISALEGGLVVARARRDVGALAVVADELGAVIRGAFPQRYARAPAG